MEYAKPWLSLDQQIDKLAVRGVDVEPRERTAMLLREVGYYRLTGYLYPFRESETYFYAGHRAVRILSTYRDRTSVAHAAQIIDFDRRLRMLMLEALERVEVGLRMQVGFALGSVSPFAHLDPKNFVPGFSAPQVPVGTGEMTSKHADWVRRVDKRRASSDEAFVAHFRDKYDDQMPIWALTEVLELGQLSTLYGGLERTLATASADAYGVPSKRVLSSWIASLNYVRNLSAHHARLFNRKLVVAPRRPAAGAVPLLDHLRAGHSSKERFGVYGAIAVTAYLLGATDSRSEWAGRVVAHVNDFPMAPNFTIASMGFPLDWTDLDLWRTA